MGEFRDVIVSLLLLLAAGAWLFIVPGLVLQGALASMPVYGTSTHEGDGYLTWGGLARRRPAARGRGRFGDHAAAQMDVVLRDRPRAGGRRHGTELGGRPPARAAGAAGTAALRRAQRRRQRVSRRLILCFPCGRNRPRVFPAVRR